MNNITEHFTFEELCRSSAATRHGVDNICPPEFITNMERVAQALELIRARFNKPIRITSCYRSPLVNKLVGGSPTSAHRFALAADFEVLGISNHKVCEVIPEVIKDYDQIIYEFGEQGWIHLGFSTVNRHQRLSAYKAIETGKTVYTNFGGLIT